MMMIRVGEVEKRKSMARRMERKANSWSVHLVSGGGGGSRGGQEELSGSPGEGR